MEDKAHSQWLRGVAKTAPELAQRVFALRGVGYYGCGFHYALERQLGQIIAFSNSYDPVLFHERIIRQVTYSDFIKALESAERSAADQ